MKKMRRCSVCLQYTFEQNHCGIPTLAAHPPKFKPLDAYAEYRRITKGIL